MATVDISSLSPREAGLEYELNKLINRVIHPVAHDGHDTTHDAETITQRLFKTERAVEFFVFFVCEVILCEELSPACPFTVAVLS